MRGRQPRRFIAQAAGLVIAAGTVFVVVHARGGASYNLKFGTAFSDGESVALIAAAVIAAALLAGVRWAAAFVIAFALLTLVLGVLHPCRIAFQDTTRFDACSASAVASALALYLPPSALVCALGLAARRTLKAPVATTLAGCGAVALLVSLWLPWYAATDDGRDYTQTGWQAFQRFDVYLVVVAVLAFVLVARPSWKRLASVVSLLALSGAGIAFYRLFTAADAPSGGYAPLAGAYVTLGALVAVALAAPVGREIDRRGGSTGRLCETRTRIRGTDDDRWGTPS